MNIVVSLTVGKLGHNAVRIGILPHDAHERARAVVHGDAARVIN